jgi:septation ring formation regulator EzrA
MSLVLEVAVVLIFAIAAFLILRKNWDKWLEAIKNKKSGKTKAKKK